MELIILAGGFGSRLKSVVNNVPKCLADINGTPFLYLLIQNWIKQGLNDFVFSLHYESEKIINFIEKEKSFLFKNCKVRYVVEPVPLGTGGAVSYVLSNLKINENFLVVNSDTWMDDGIPQLINSKPPTILSVHVDNVSRYGKLEIDHQNFIKKFNEKEDLNEKGFINAGFYHLSKKNFFLIKKTSFSIEKDLFLKLKDMKAIKVKSSFIDIGIPKDYYKFCDLIKKR